jgi:hypothetical protein
VLGLIRIADPEEKGDSLSVVLSDVDSAKDGVEETEKETRRMKRRGGKR